MCTGVNRGCVYSRMHVPWESAAWSRSHTDKCSCISHLLVDYLRERYCAGWPRADYVLCISQTPGVVGWVGSRREDTQRLLAAETLCVWCNNAEQQRQLGGERSRPAQTTCAGGFHTQAGPWPRTGSDACDAVVAATDAVELKEAKVAVDLAGLLCTLWVVGLCACGLLRRRSVDGNGRGDDFTGDGSCDAPPSRTTPTTSVYADSLRAVCGGPGLTSVNGGTTIRLVTRRFNRQRM